jgi:hypothetical protein
MRRPLAVFLIGWDYCGRGNEDGPLDIFIQRSLPVRLRQHLHCGIDLHRGMAQLRPELDQKTALVKEGDFESRNDCGYLRKIARIGNGPWSWTASLPQGGCLIRFRSECKVHVATVNLRSTQSSWRH